MLEISVKGEGVVKTLHGSLSYSLGWIDEKHGCELWNKNREPHRRSYFCVRYESRSALSCCQWMPSALRMARRYCL